VAVRPPEALEDVPELLVALRQRVDRAYVHVDVDFLDPRESPGVSAHAPGGLSVARGVELLGAVMASVPAAAVAITNFNPEMDEAGRSRRAVFELLAAVRASA
jgi:arginase